jgi:putative hydroxymethylpyrimidine transporter CytX
MNLDLQPDLNFRHFLFLWFGAAISMAEIMTGGLLAPLGFKNGLLIILVGHTIGTTILILGGIIGTQERVPALTSTRISFGLYGSYLFSLCNLLQLIGWTAVMIISAARSVNLISSQLWHFNNLQLWSIFIGILVCLWVFSGKAGFKKVNVIAVSLLLVLTLALSFVVFKSSKLWEVSLAPKLWSNWGLGMELNIVMPLSWLPLIADYTRFAKSTKAGVLGSWVGYFVGSSWMYLIGLGTAVVSNSTDPTPLMLATNLGLTALGIIILATVTTTFLDVYSAGVTFLNIFPRFNERTVAIMMGVIGTIIAIIVPIEQYQNFLYMIGSIFAPLFAILLTEYFLIRKYRSVPEDLLINWGAIFIWIFGIVLYYIFIDIGFILGATLPVMALTGLIYLLSWRRISNWKTFKTLTNSYQR